MTSKSSETFKIRRVLELVAENQHKIALCEGRDVIVCLGRNQGGKSTLYNSLVHGLLDWKEVETNDSKKINRLLPLHVQEGFEVAKTGDNLNAETVFPCAYKLLDDKVFLDTRGFFDPRHMPMDEAAAAILTDIAIRTARTVRILWLQPYDAFHASGVSGIERIGHVFSRIIYDGAPILFLFNKQLTLDSDARKSDKQLAFNVFEAKAGECESMWPQFQELALREIKRIVEYVLSIDESNQIGLFQKIMKIWNGSPPPDVDTLVFADRSKFLAHFHDSINANRVLFVDPKFETSISDLRKAINSLPPALTREPTSPDGVLKALNFSDYCDHLREFRRRFNSELEVFNALLKARKVTKELPAIQALIESKRAEVKRTKQILDDVNNGKDLIKYQEQFMGESSISVIVEERNRILAKISKIDKELKDVIEGEPFVAVVPFNEFCLWPWKTPTATVVYEDEPFASFKDFPDSGVIRKTTVSDKPPRFEAVYARVKSSEDTKEAPPGNSEDLLALAKKYLPEKLGICIDTAMDIWECISSRRCSGRVEFYIDSEVHNKQFIEQKEKEVEKQKIILEKKNIDIEHCKEKRDLSEVVQTAIDTAIDNIEKLKMIKVFQEKVQETLHSIISTPENPDKITLEEMIERCRPIVLHFFKQKDGIMDEFLRLLNSQPEEGPLDVDSLFFDSLACAEQIKPFYPSFGDIFEDDNDNETRQRKRRRVS